MICDCFFCSDFHYYSFSLKICLNSDIANIYSIYIFYHEYLIESPQNIDLREHLTVFGTYKLDSYDKLDELCELADKLNDFGSNNRVSADGYDLCKKKKGLKNMNSNEIREFFEE